MLSHDFWLKSLERAIKTFAQALAAVLGAGAVGVLDVDWPQALSASLLAGLISLLTSVASTRVGDPETPSVVSIDE